MGNRKIRVRSKKFEQISADRMALALWLMARDVADTENTDANSPTQADEDQTSHEETS